MANVSAYPDNGLKVYTWENEEWCVATSPEEAAKAYAEHVGKGVSEEAIDPASWVECDPWKIFNFRADGGAGKPEADTFANWARKIPAGHFASTDC